MFYDFPVNTIHAIDFIRLNGLREHFIDLSGLISIYTLDIIIPSELSIQRYFKFYEAISYTNNVLKIDISLEDEYE